MKCALRYTQVIFFISLFSVFAANNLYGMLTIPQHKKVVRKYATPLRERAIDWTPFIQKQLKKEYEEAVKIDEEKLKQDKQFEEQQQQKLGLSLTSEKPKIDPHIPHIAIICSDQSKIYVPENIANMSPFIQKTIAFNKKHKPDEADKIELSDYPGRVIDNAFKIIEKKEKQSIYEQIKNYSLDDLLPITDLLEHLGFDIDIQKPFLYQVYLLSKQMDDVLPLLDFLENATSKNIFANFVMQSFKNNIIRSTVNDESRITKLALPDSTYPMTTMFSPDQKMIAVGSNARYPRNLLFFRENNRVEQENDIQGTIECLDFFPDSKSLVIGCNTNSENLFLLKIGSDGNIEKTAQKLHGHSDGINGVTIHPSGKAMISVSSGKTGVTILLREIELNREIKEPKALVANDITWIGKSCFNSDGTLLMCIGSKAKIKNFNYPWIFSRVNCLVVWEFEKNGMLKSEKPIIYEVPHIDSIFNISWLPHTKSCIIAGKSGDRVNLRGLMLCDLSNFNNITYKIIENYKRDGHRVAISPDAQIIIAQNSILILGDDGSIVSNGDILTAEGWPASFGADSNQIIFAPAIRHHHNIEVYTILMQEEQRTINELQKLSLSQLLLIDRILDRINDLDIANISNILLQKKLLPDEVITLLKILKPTLSTTLKSLSLEPQEELPSDIQSLIKKIATEKEPKRPPISISPITKELPTSEQEQKQGIKDLSSQTNIKPMKQQPQIKETSPQSSTFFDWLKNWTMKTFWSSSKTITPKE